MTAGDILIAAAASATFLTLVCFFMSTGPTANEELWLGLVVVFALASIWLWVAA